MKLTAERILIGILAVIVIIMAFYVWSLRTKVGNLIEKELERTNKEIKAIEEGQGAVEKERAAGAVQTIVIREEKNRKDEELKNIRPSDLDADGGEDYFTKRYPRE